jgi:hypothetical protein
MNREEALEAAVAANTAEQNKLRAEIGELRAELDALKPPPRKARSPPKKRRSPSPRKPSPRSRPRPPGEFYRPDRGAFGVRRGHHADVQGPRGHGLPGLRGLGLHVLPRRLPRRLRVGSGASGEYTFTIAATSTDDIRVGQYAWEIRASLSGAVYTAYTGRTEVTANLGVLTATDSRSWTEKMIAVLESLLYGSGTIPEIESYQIHGRALTKMGRAELFSWLKQLRGELSAQSGGGKKPAIRTYFGNAR